MNTTTQSKPFTSIATASLQPAWRSHNYQARVCSRRRQVHRVGDEHRWARGGARETQKKRVSWRRTVHQVNNGVVRNQVGDDDGGAARETRGREWRHTFVHDCFVSYAAHAAIGSRKACLFQPDTTTYCVSSGRMVRAAWLRVASCAARACEPLRTHLQHAIIAPSCPGTCPGCARTQTALAVGRKKRGSESECGAFNAPMLPLASFSTSTKLDVSCAIVRPVLARKADHAALVGRKNVPTYALLAVTPFRPAAEKTASVTAREEKREEEQPTAAAWRTVEERRL